MMPLRLFCYMARIWERWLRQIPEEEATCPELPLIFPIVLYQGKPEWNAARSLRELAAPIPKDLRPYFPDFSFHLETLTTRPDLDFAPGLAQLGISVLKLMWDEDFVTWLRRFGEQLLELHQRGEHDRIRVLLVYASSQVSQERRSEFIEYLHEHLPAMTTSGNSIYDSLINEGMEKGREEERKEMLQATIRNMQENGMSVDDIIRVTGWERSEVEEFYCSD